MGKRKPEWMRHEKKIIVVNPFIERYQTLSEKDKAALVEVIKRIAGNKQILVISFEDRAKDYATNLTEALDAKNRHEAVEWTSRYNSILATPRAHALMWHAEADFDIVVVIIERMSPDDFLSSYRRRSKKIAPIINDVASIAHLCNYS